MLVGERVGLMGGEWVGTIVATGHQYGPGGGHDQASVYVRRWDAGRPDDPHPAKRAGRWVESCSWYYLDQLHFHSENAAPSRPEHLKGANDAEV